MKMTKLAAALAVIGREGEVMDTKASAVLQIVRAEKIKDGKTFNAAVRAAYKVNGWNSKPGKPKEGKKDKDLTPPPATVKQYVSTIRAAYRFGLPVGSYSSFYALRTEVKEKRAARKPKHRNVPPQMIGITLKQPDQFNGGIFHDLAILHDALDRARKPRMLSALERVKKDFATAAPQLVIPLAMPELRTGTHG